MYPLVTDEWFLEPGGMAGGGVCGLAVRAVSECKLIRLPSTPESETGVVV